MSVINLTQHPATDEQKVAGVVDLQGKELEALKGLLTFDSIPTIQEMEDRAHDIALLVVFNDLADDEDQDPIFNKAMIGGAPFFMSTLERELINQGITPVYAFSRREVIEQKQENGEVVKKAVFKHLGFVEV